MKSKLIIIIPVVLLGLIAVAHYFVVSNIEDVEIQKYSVVKKDGDIELRTYGTSIVAKTETEGNYDKASTKGFKKLAGYIFGGNEQQEKISMTAPVWMTTDTLDSEMQFIMPAKYSLNELPNPSDSSIQLAKFSGGLFAAIVFGGFADDKKIAHHKQLLITWLKDNNYPTDGESYFLGYNSPFKLKHRRNEVLISLD